MLFPCSGWRWKCLSPPKHSYPATTLHGDITNKKTTWISVDFSQIGSFIDWNFKFQLLYVLELPGRLSSISGYHIPEDDDRDGLRNVGSIQTPDTADSTIRLYQISTVLSCVGSKDRVIVKDEMEIMWKKMAVVYLKILCRNLTGRSRENHGSLRSEIQNWWSPP
jgi:hypothetical protein